MEVSRTDIAARALGLNGYRPGETVRDEDVDRVRQTAWMLVEADSAKAKRDKAMPFSKLVGAALPEPESPIETLLETAMGAIPLLAGQWVGQQDLGPYRVDFAFPALRLAIECDGAAFHREPSQIKRDQMRDRFLSKLGWKVIRFTGSEIRRSAAACAVRIARYVEVLRTL